MCWEGTVDQTLSKYKAWFPQFHHPFLYTMNRSHVAMPFCNSLSEVHFYIPLAVKIPEKFIMHSFEKFNLKPMIVVHRD